MKVRVTPSRLTGTVAAPPSKSYTHRAVIIGSLAAGRMEVENFLDSADTRYTIDACRALGVRIESAGDILRIDGNGGEFPPLHGSTRLFVGNSGSTLRMMAPVAALSPAAVIWDGEPRLRERPVGELIAALKSLGVETRYPGNEGFPPIEVRGGRLEGGEIDVSGGETSQHISGLLMAAPYMENGLKIRLADGLHSKPYLDVTMDAMRAFGVVVVNRDYELFRVAGGQKYRARRYRVEGDYSAAAFFFAAAAVTGSSVNVSGLSPESVQGDRHLLGILAEMGCRVTYNESGVGVAGEALRGVSVDMGDYPDIVQPLAAVAAYAQGKTRIYNIAHLKHKETDRMADTAAELARMGIRVDVGKDSLTVHGGRPRGANIDAHGDHRMVMSLAIAALAASGETIISGVEAIAKSYPAFFEDLARLGAKIEVLP